MRWVLGLVVLAGWGLGCSGGTTSTPPPPDAGVAGFPPPAVGSTPAGDALANAPARCGQPAHTWLRSTTLGTVGSRGDVTHYTADFVEGLVLTAGLTPPKPVVYDAKFATITYQTQDRGVPQDATGLIAWPFGLRATDPKPPILLLLHGTQGFTDGCSVDQTDGAAVLAAYFASLGYVVVMPDYLGLKARPPATGYLHPYLVGQATAIASLDMVRAAGRLDPAQYDNVQADNRVVFVGGSQGGHAALWVDLLAPYYAPELNLLGGVATVPPADLYAQSVRALTSVVDATANVIGVLGTNAGWYGLTARLAEVFKPPYDTIIPMALGEDCDPTDRIPDNAELTTLFQPLLLDAAPAGTLASVPQWGCVFSENGLTTTSIPRQGGQRPSYGMLMVMGGNDDLVHTPIERAAFETLCAAGTPLRYLECDGAGHVQATLWALPEILAFTDARLAGETFTAACTAPAAVRCQGTPP